MRYFKDLRQWRDDYSEEFATQRSDHKVRRWAKSYDLTDGKFRYGFGSWNGRPDYDELLNQYQDEKPGQARCADCGHCYLWRTDPKTWEFACWQFAHPLEAAHDLDQESFKCEKGTYRDTQVVNYGNLVFHLGAICLYFLFFCVTHVSCMCKLRRTCGDV